MNLDLHRVKSVKVLRLQTYKETIWQTIEVEFELGKIQITLFPENPEKMPTITLEK